MLIATGTAGTGGLSRKISLVRANSTCGKISLTQVDNCL